jgi:hypothetical protein
MEEEIFKVGITCKHEAISKTNKPQIWAYCTMSHGKETWEDPTADNKMNFKISEPSNGLVTPSAENRRRWSNQSTSVGCARLWRYATSCVRIQRSRILDISVYTALVGKQNFRRVRKIAKSDYYLHHVSQSVSQSVCLSVYPSVCLCICRSAWNNSAPTGRIVMKFDIWVFFENLWGKIQFSLKSDNNNGTLHEDLNTFMISRWILLRMRNVSKQSCRENQNTFYLQ